MQHCSFFLSFFPSLPPCKVPAQPNTFLLYGLEAVQDCSYLVYMEFGHLQLFMLATSNFSQPKSPRTCSMGWLSWAHMHPESRRLMPSRLKFYVSPWRDLGKGKALKVVCGAKPFSHGRNNPLHVGIVPAYFFFLNGPYWQYPKCRQIFPNHLGPTCAAEESLFVWEEAITAVMIWTSLVRGLWSCSNVQASNGQDLVKWAHGLFKKCQREITSTSFYESGLGEFIFLPVLPVLKLWFCSTCRVSKCMWLNSLLGFLCFYFLCHKISILAHLAGLYCARLNKIFT